MSCPPQFLLFVFFGVREILSFALNVEVKRIAHVVNHFSDDRYEIILNRCLHLVDLAEVKKEHQAIEYLLL